MVYEFANLNEIKLSGSVAKKGEQQGTFAGNQTRIVPKESTRNLEQERLEFRIAKKQPEDGFTEVEIESTGQKIYVGSEVIANSKSISAAEVVVDGSGKPALSVKFTPQGANKMLRATIKNRNDFLAIVIDGKVRSIPVIRDPISSEAMLTGEFRKEELDLLAKAIKTK